MADEFAAAAAELAIKDLEQELIESSRQYEDAQRSGDATSAAYALRNYTAAQVAHEKLTGANQPRQPGLSNAQQNFLSRRAALGDELTPARMKDYAAAHVRAVSAGLEENSPAYFRAIEGHVDSLGDGRQPPLNERTAAELCGVDDETYAANAAKLRQLKARGFYQE